LPLLVVGPLVKLFPAGHYRLNIFEWLVVSPLYHFQSMVSFLLRRPFVKILQIFSISNAAVACQMEMWILETFLSVCARCISNRQLLQR